MELGSRTTSISIVRLRFEGLPLGAGMTCILARLLPNRSCEGLGPGVGATLRSAVTPTLAAAQPLNCSWEGWGLVTGPFQNLLLD